ncbi:DMT family transporter [Telmatospirillum sp.]|uniref:DMT family transporter n=1 Tax=Telmatospirillum sp. TaxID=2079197 RepID=UPI00284F86B4|nr:DMT family transporter [Telmatospirillum sp.]MDR3437490.1 DMT family transporter [Telmatospirillum sp.]
MKNRAMTPSVEMVAAMALSGTIGFFVVESGQSPFNVVFFRCLFGALCLFFYCYAKGLLRKLSLSRRTLALIGVGGLAIVFNWVALFASYSRTTIGISTTIYHVQPIFVFFAGAVLFGERITLNRLLWLVVAFGGALLVIRPNGSTIIYSPDYLIGCGLALLAAALYAVATLITKRLKGVVTPHVIALSQLVIGIVVLAPLADFGALPARNFQWECLAVLGLVHSCIMYILMYSAFQQLPTASIAVLSFAYPAIAVLVDYLAYGHLLTVVQIAGALMVLLAGIGNNLNIDLIGRLLHGAPAAPVKDQSL